MVQVGTLDASSAREARAGGVLGRASRKKPEGIKTAFNIDDGHGLLVRRAYQVGDQQVEQLAVAARESQRRRLCGSKMAIDKRIEWADWERLQRSARWRWICSVAGIFVVVGGGCEACAEGCKDLESDQHSTFEARR